MRLHVREGGGEGAPLVLLHGLYGSSRNWSSTMRRLTAARCFALDLRNHGDSPRAEDMGYEALAGDVVETADALGLGSFCLMGHSLGGKVAMRLACRQPQRVDRLVVLDIAPRRYEPETRYLDAMLGVPAATLEGGDRAAVETALEEGVPDRDTRLFLMTNLERAPGDGGPAGLRWRLPLRDLRAALPGIASSPLEPEDRYEGPADFVVGGDSDYVGRADRVVIERHFAQARIHRLEGVGHNVHVEDAERFLALLRTILGERPAR